MIVKPICVLHVRDALFGCSKRISKILCTFLLLHWKCNSCAAQLSVRTRKVTRKLESICSRKSKPKIKEPSDKQAPPLLDMVSSAAVSRPKVKPKPKPKGLVQTKLSF